MDEADRLTECPQGQAGGVEKILNCRETAEDEDWRAFRSLRTLSSCNHFQE